MTDDNQIRVTLDADSGENLILILQSKVYELLDEIPAADQQIKQAKVVYDNAMRAAFVVRRNIEAICEFLNQTSSESLKHDEETWQQHIGFDKLKDPS